MSTADLTFNLSIDELKGTAGTSPFDIDLIQKGYPLFGFDKEMHLHLLAEYVPKLYPKNQIKKWLQSNPDKTFLQMIHPSDIALTRHTGLASTRTRITLDQR